MLYVVRSIIVVVFKRMKIIILREFCFPVALVLLLFCKSNRDTCLNSSVNSSRLLWGCVVYDCVRASCSNKELMDTINVSAF